VIQLAAFQHAGFFFDLYSLVLTSVSSVPCQRLEIRYPEKLCNMRNALTGYRFLYFFFFCKSFYALLLHLLGVWGKIQLENCIFFFILE